MAGLSPRVRGNPEDPPPAVARGGSIPACAGEPGGGLGGVATKGVYPRVCGGTQRAKTQGDRPKGLSPRVRGNRPELVRRRVADGSIPACAGEPTPPSWRVWGGRVYPRVCGGTAPCRLKVGVLAGLSPRVRGNRRPGQAGVHPCGSIPACAGEPATQCESSAPSRVYPRVCGGTMGVNDIRRMEGGLSPRVRGNPWPHRPSGRRPHRG